MNESPTQGQRLLVVVNLTEWRNLCARGSIRIAEYRVCAIDPNSSPSDYARLFCVAPTTKIDSSIDLMVLELQPEWMICAKPHGRANGIKILGLDQVRSHRPTAADQLDYFVAEGSKVGVLVQEPDLESHWRNWVAMETISAAIESTSLLLSHFLPSFEQAGMTTGGATIESVVRTTLGLHASEDLFGKLLAGAIQIDDACAAVRGSEAFAVACCIEWIDLSLGIDLYAEKPLAAVLQSAVSVTRSLRMSPRGISSTEAEAALDLIEAAHPTAFTSDLSARAVYVSIDLMARVRFDSPNPEVIGEMLLGSVRQSAISFPFVAAVAATLIGPELVRQVTKNLAMRTR